jgi:hypothetical protein
VSPRQDNPKRDKLAENGSGTSGKELVRFEEPLVETFRLESLSEEGVVEDDFAIEIRRESCRPFPTQCKQRLLLTLWWLHGT